MEEIAKIVLMRARPGKAAALDAALRKLIVATRQEPGCIINLLHKAAGDDDLFMVYERWRGEAGFAAHMKQQHTADFLARIDELLAEAPDVRSFDFLF